LVVVVLLLLLLLVSLLLLLLLLLLMVAHPLPTKTNQWMPLHRPATSCHPTQKE
jgi:hypothetical protein